MTILKAAGTVILREETYYLEKYFEKPFGINETCGYRCQQEPRIGEQRSFGELAEGGPGSILRWGHLFHGTMFGV